MRDHLAECERERPGLLVSSKLQLVPLLHSYLTLGDPAGNQLLVVPEQPIVAQIVQDAIVGERKLAESDHDCDKLFQPV